MLVWIIKVLKSLSGHLKFLGDADFAARNSLRFPASPPASLSCCPGLGLDGEDLPSQMSFSDWPQLKRIFSDRFATRTQSEWCAVFDGTDACVTPVLSFDQVNSHPHNQERASFIRDASGEESPAPAPLLCRTPAEPCLAPDPAIGEHTAEVLREFGFAAVDVEKMHAAGVVECNGMKARL